MPDDDTVQDDNQLSRTAALAEIIHEYRAPEPCFHLDPYEECWTEARYIVGMLPPHWCGHRAEIADLYDRLADEGYKDAIRLAEAVNEVVLHQRGSIEEAWKYGDEQRALTIKQGRELIAAEATIARLRQALEKIATGVRGGQAIVHVETARAALEEDR